MVGFTHNQLKNKSFDEVQKTFDKTMGWIDSFVPIDAEIVKGSETKAEGSSKRAGEDLQQKSTKKEKVDDDDKEKEDLKQCFEIVPEEEVAINVIPLATKLAPIVEKTYYLTPATITEMLNKKLQAEYWNEICYQLLKLMTKLVKKK
ncbi:hypothetical protein Tco_0126346 [Tanacetum coccineum]